MRYHRTRGVCALLIGSALAGGPALCAPVTRVSAGAFPISSAVVVPAGAQTV